MCRDALRKILVQDKVAIQKIMMALVSKACEGDMAAIREIFDRIDGKVPQALVGDDDPLQIVVNIRRWGEDAARWATPNKAFRAFRLYTS